MRHITRYVDLIIGAQPLAAYLAMLPFAALADEASLDEISITATLIDGLARAFYWQHLLDTGAMKSGSAIARAEKLPPSVINELLRLTLLAPDIIEQFMAGKQPRRLTLMWFQRNRLPVDWQVQRELMASFEGEA